MRAKISEHKSGLGFDVEGRNGQALEHVGVTELTELCRTFPSVCHVCRLRKLRGGPCCGDPDHNRCRMPWRQEIGAYLTPEQVKAMRKRFGKATRALAKARTRYGQMLDANTEELKGRP